MQRKGHETSLDRDLFVPTSSIKSQTNDSQHKRATPRHVDSIRRQSRDNSDQIPERVEMRPNSWRVDIIQKPIFASTPGSTRDLVSTYPEDVFDGTEWTHMTNQTNIQPVQLSPKPSSRYSSRSNDSSRYMVATG